MSTYTRPAVTRSYDAIYADISEAIHALPTDSTVGHSAFWRAHAEGCERLRDLWNEIVYQASEDRALPRWAASAAHQTRERYAAEARDARDRASRKNTFQ